MRILILAAVVLTVLALIAAASKSGLCLGIGWFVWTSAGLLAYFTELLLGDWATGQLTTWRAGPRRAEPPPP